MGEPVKGKRYSTDEALQFILYGNKETENNENVDIPSDLDLLPVPCDEIYSNDEQMNIDDYHEDDVVSVMSQIYLG